MPNSASSAAAQAAAEPEALAVPLGPAITVLPALKRVVAVKVIPRDVGPDIAPGQSVMLPGSVADAAIEAGQARDADAEPAGKSKA
jgi:hypothetical protein